MSYQEILYDFLYFNINMYIFFYETKGYFLTKVDLKNYLSQRKKKLKEVAT